VARRVWLALALIVVAAALAGWLRPDLTDLHVYRYGGRALLDGLSPYTADEPVTGLPFTYPPFAAATMLPLAVLPAQAAAAVWTAASVTALTAVVVVALREVGLDARGWLVPGLVLGALALEPVWQNLTFGQVNLVLMAAVVVDVTRPERRYSGVLVGLAAGIKLTPLVFVVLLLLVGRRAAAGRATVTFLATVGVGFVLAPGAAAPYWTLGLLDADRVGPPWLAHNQSVYGVLTRLLDESPPALLWLGVALPLLGAMLVLATAWWRRGDRLLGTGLAGLAMLLASPVSWSHHWVWAVPVAIALWPHGRALAVAWTFVFVARPVLWPPWGERRELTWGFLDHVAGDAYVLAAVGIAVWAAVRLAHESAEPDRSHSSARMA
jgi:alpha-1,2-mannosyltransferase